MRGVIQAVVEVNLMDLLKADIARVVADAVAGGHGCLR